jgi:hypothetical protein
MRKYKIRVLFLAANPDSRTPLELGREYNKIRDAIAGSKYRAAFELIAPEFSAQLETVSAALIEHRPHVVHFAGHGSQSQGLILEDKNHRHLPIGKAELTKLFKTLRGAVRLVFLNACYSDEQARLLTDVFDYAIGSEGLIEDRCAVDFARAFYRHLALGGTVSQAFLAAQFGIKNCGPVTSDLLKRPGVRDDVPFILQVCKPLAGKPKPKRSALADGQMKVENYGEIGAVVSGSNITVKLQRRER